MVFPVLHMPRLSAKVDWRHNGNFKKQILIWTFAGRGRQSRFGVAQDDPLTFLENLQYQVKESFNLPGRSQRHCVSWPKASKEVDYIYTAPSACGDQLLRNVFLTEMTDRISYIPRIVETITHMSQ